MLDSPRPAQKTRRDPVGPKLSARTPPEDNLDTSAGQSVPEQAQPPAVACAECLEATARPVAGRRGEALCRSCAESFYAPCAACGGLVPLDEAVKKEAALYCLDCEAQPAGVAPEDVPDESEVETLVAEYVALHAEESRVKKRLDEIKERLKVASSVRHRVAGAVTLRAGDAAVQCSFKAAIKCDEEKVAELERALEADQFESLFQRSVKYSPVRENLERLLADSSDETAGLRRLVLPVVERTEQAVLTVVRAKKGKSET